MCITKKSRFIKERETSGLLSSLGLKTTLSKVLLVGSLLFWRYKMNKITSKVLLTREKFMSEMHLRQYGFTSSACGPFTKNRKSTKIKLKKTTGDSWYIYQNELDKGCFQHDMVYGDFIDLPRRVTSDKVLCDKAFNVAKYPKYGYQRGLVSIVYKFLIKILLLGMHNQRP